MSTHLVRGGDAALVSEALARLVRDLVGDEDRALVVTEVDLRATGDDAAGPAQVADAAGTPPFLTSRRVVVARGLGARDATGDLGPLLAYLADPLDTTELVLEWGSGRVPKALADAVKSGAGAVVDTDPPRGRELDGWLREREAEAGVRLDAEARRLVVSHVGEDLARVSSLLALLAATAGDGAPLTSAEVAPFLGEAGGVPPWELTDALDRGDAASALERLHRMTGSGGRHPLQLLAVLHGHYARMLALDGAGAGAADEKAAAAVLGLKGSTFPARKALEQGRRMGHDRLAQAVQLLARADDDLKGGSGLPGDVVLEVLVARLSRLSRMGGAPRRGRR